MNSSTNFQSQGIDSSNRNVLTQYMDAVNSSLWTKKRPKHTHLHCPRCRRLFPRSACIRPDYDKTLCLECYEVVEQLIEGHRSRVEKELAGRIDFELTEEAGG